MAGEQPEQPLGPFVCEFCGEVGSSSRALAGHIKAHGKGKAPMKLIPYVPPPSAFGPGPYMMPPVMPPLFGLAPPPSVMALGLGQPVAPPRLFYGGLLPRRQVRPQAPPPPWDPVVSAGPGGTIRMVLLEPNHAFWAPYRTGMDPPEELDFMGLGLRRRLDSPSPSFESWLNNA